MMNIGNPAAAFRRRSIHDGVGFARMEFVVIKHITIHPMALVSYEKVEDENAKRQIAVLTEGYQDKTEYFVDRLAGAWPGSQPLFIRAVIVRFSDFKTNEYAHLIGGAAFEPPRRIRCWGGEAPPDTTPAYYEGFLLECRAIRRVRERYGFPQCRVMIPFCRPEGGRRVLAVMAEAGLAAGDGLEVYVMCEIPSNSSWRAFAKLFDGFSIGSNDLTQLLLGVDRDSADLAQLFDEQDEAVKRDDRECLPRGAQGRREGRIVRASAEAIIRNSPSSLCVAGSTLCR